MSELIHKVVYHVTNLLIYIFALSFIYSYDRHSAVLLAVLIVMRFLANELYHYEVRKKDEEIIREMEALLRIKDNDKDN